MIIAFGHQKRRGKDTCGMLLEMALRVKYSRIKVERKSFAAPLKAIAHQLYGWAGLKDSVFYENNPDAREVVLPIIGKTPRQIWIDLGTPAIRQNVWDDTWAALTINSCKKDTVSIITDLRFPNEVHWVKRHNGLCVNVIRPGLETPTDVADTALNGMNQWDHIINNDGSLTDLSKKIDALVETLHVGF